MKMKIEELKETEEWKAASKQKRHAFLSLIEKKLKSERKTASAIKAVAQKATANRPPAISHPKNANKKLRKKVEGKELTTLAYDILRCSGINGSRLGGIGLFGAVAPRVVEVLGSTYSGSVKVFMRENKKKLREWCQLNWIPRVKAQPSKAQSHHEPLSRLVARQPTEQSVKSFIVNHSKVNPASDDFLSTFEWKATRMMALKKYGPVCQCCGASAKTGAVIHVDHIKPRKIFPDLALNIDNLQILCGDCNGGKGNWDMTDWRTSSAPQQAPACQA